jgi:hypothetical protein
MKRWFFMLLIFHAFLAADGQKRLTAEGKNVKLTWGQVTKSSGTIFGEYIPYGQVWNAGEGKTTQISFAKDGTFGGLPIKAGTYNLFIIPNEKDWTIILNAAPADSSSEYESVKDKDVLKVTVPAKKISTRAESLNYRFSDTQLIIEWGMVQVVVQVQV